MLRFSSHSAGWDGRDDSLRHGCSPRSSCGRALSARGAVEEENRNSRRRTRLSGPVGATLRWKATALACLGHFRKARLSDPHRRGHCSRRAEEREQAARAGRGLSEPHLLRSKRYQTTVYPDRNKEDVEPQGVEGDWFDSLPANSPGPEQEAMRQKETAWLLEQFRQEPELEAILRLQLEMDGYNAFTNLELARMLTVPVAEIENRKRRLKTRLDNLASGRQMRRTKHG